MFTGIVQGVAKVKSISNSNRGADISIVLSLGKRLARGVRAGDSVSVSGTCLTVTRVLGSGTAAEFQLVAETTRRTFLGSLQVGDSVNIERSLKIGDRLEGHFVLGHVDGMGRIAEIVRSKSETTVWIELADDVLFRPLIMKGSITVDGVSLTITGLDKDRRRFSVSLIPHTLDVTALGTKKKGDPVNIEIDVLGKYVSQILGSNFPSDQTGRNSTPTTGSSG